MALELTPAMEAPEPATEQPTQPLSSQSDAIPTAAEAPKSEPAKVETGLVATGLAGLRFPEFTNKMSPEEKAAVLDLQKKHFTEMVMAARTPPPKPPVVQPVAPLIQQRTSAEMAAGQRANAFHAAQQANRPAPRRDPREGGTVPVFRPADYIPNMKQGTVRSAAQDV